MWASVKPNSGSSGTDDGADGVVDIISLNYFTETLVVDACKGL